MENLENSSLIPPLSKLGRAIYIYGCVYIISFAIGFIIGFVPGYPFAKKMFMYILMILEDITFAMIILKAKNLRDNFDCIQSHKFYAKLLLGFILSIISFVTNLILSFALADRILIFNADTDPDLTMWFWALLPDIISGLITIAAAIFYIIAWGQLGSLVGNNARLLPPLQMNVSLRGINNIQTGYRIQIITFFTGILGWHSILLFTLDPILSLTMLVLFIAGFIRTGKSLKILDNIPANAMQRPSGINPNLPLGNKLIANAEPQQQPNVFSSKKSPNYANINDISDSSRSIQQKFCPTCGAPVNVNQKFCTKCGIEIRFD